MRITHVLALSAFAFGGEPQDVKPEVDQTPEVAVVENREPQSRPGTCPPTDPFCAKLNEAETASKQHDALQASVESRIEAMPICADGIYDAVAKVRDASAGMHATYLGYLQEWRKLAEKDKALFRRLTQSKSGLRAELDKRLRELGHEITELDQRERTLHAALRQAGAEPNGREVQALASLRENKAKRAANIQRMQTKWDQTLHYYNGSLENTLRLEAMLGEMVKVTESGAELWQTYYESLEARASHDCTKRRGPTHTAITDKLPPL